MLLMGVRSGHCTFRIVLSTLKPHTESVALRCAASVGSLPPGS